MIELARVVLPRNGCHKERSMTDIVINVSAPHYNLGAAKIVDWLRAQGRDVVFFNGDPARLGDAVQRRARVALGLRVKGEGTAEVRFAAQGAIGGIAPSGGAVVPP